MKTLKNVIQFSTTAALILFLGTATMSFRTLSPAASVSQASPGTCPTAAFAYANGPGNLSVTFLNQSTSNTSCLWEFGDGTTSTERNPQHTYATRGSFTVRLTVSGQGCQDAIIGTVDVIMI